MARRGDDPRIVIRASAPAAGSADLPPEWLDPGEGRRRAGRGPQDDVEARILAAGDQPRREGSSRAETKPAPAGRPGAGMRLLTHQARNEQRGGCIRLGITDCLQG